MNLMPVYSMRELVYKNTKYKNTNSGFNFRSCILYTDYLIQNSRIQKHKFYDIFHSLYFVYRLPYTKIQTVIFSSVMFMLHFSQSFGYFVNISQAELSSNIKEVASLTICIFV